MSIIFNNTVLPTGSKQYFNGTEVKKIFFNSTLVWEYDKEAPIITITSAGGYISSSTYTLSGTVTDSGSGVNSVTVNGTSVTINSNGAFSKQFTGISGTQTFTIVATDNAGNSRTVSHTVKYDNSEHAIPMSSLYVLRTAWDGNYGWDYNSSASGGSQLYEFYVEVSSRSKCSGSGQHVWVTASFSGEIYVSNLPDWQNIKRIVISKYGTGTQTINLNGSTATVSFSDSNSNGYTEHDVGDYASTSAKAGIISAKYYYT